MAMAESRIDYRADIEPIFRTSCYSCHSGATAAAGLRLDSKTGALAAGRRVIAPGDSAHSTLLQRLLASDPKVRMPLGGTALPAEKIARLRAWIDQGAPWPDQTNTQTHWAYVKPSRPPVPAVNNTAVNNSAWVRDPIDAFVLARLETERLAPSPAAEREVLLRRVSLDLTGLPPTPKEVAEFAADRSTDAYEKTVDRLLASPHYGERWARPWLDLARYADTNGFEADRRRSNWKYRDWVIDALNRDMPFDEFTIQQLAGDMLPNAAIEHRIATGFHRNTMFNEEGGVDQEEGHWDILVDRVNTTATVWLGSTLGCAQCHDHKYDPFTRREYYQFLAFFNNSDTRPRPWADRAAKMVEPRLELPTPAQDRKRAELEAEIRELEQRLKTPTAELARAQQEWETSVAAASRKWTTLYPERMQAADGVVLTRQPDGAILVSGENPRNQWCAIEAKTAVTGMTGIRIEALPDPSLPRGGPGRDAYGNFLLTAFEVEAAPATSPGQFERVSWQEMVADNGKINDKKFRQLWTVDASREDGRLPRQIVFFAAAPFGSGETVLRIRLRQESAFSGQGMGHFRLSVTSAADPTTVVSVSHRLRALLAAGPSDRTEAQRKELTEYYLSVAPALQRARKRLVGARKELEDLGIVTTMVMAERAPSDHPTANVRLRGAFLSKGELVDAGTPSALPPMPEREPHNRLGLARWLVSKENPLTARVTVNRIWEQFFGRGMVETSEDLGTQGARPTHPELLDWLAAEFMDSGWSMKHIARLIVNSATYRQSSRVAPDLLERDPYNRLLARGPRFRMEAEMIRDVALAASGLLSPKIGGPSVFPPQPEGVWDMPYNEDKWKESQGEDRYRRGLYTFSRRTSPYPALLNFDATSREACTVRRIRTNTPLQALTTLNDPAFFEAARTLARRVVGEAGKQRRRRAELAFRLCLSRAPTPGELDRILTWERREHQYFHAHRSDAQKLTGSTDPDLAAWTMLSNVLLNLDETITRE
jgi:hypothetical protein